MNKIIKSVIFVLLFITMTASASGKKDSKTAVKNIKTQVIASTPWTAAFADIAGIDDVESIAPANLRHPPEYEITVSDIQKLTKCKYLIYAGYERMMKTLADSTGSVQLIKINTDNSVATVQSQARVIASILHTEKKCEERISSYAATISQARKQVEEKGLSSKKVLVHAMQVYLAKDLGFTVFDTFGPEPLTAEQIKKAKEENYDIIIDNVHNPVASPLADVCPNAVIVAWRNFPDTMGRGALEAVIRENVNKLFVK